MSGLTFALVVDSPPVMADGGWKLGVVMDGAATEQQAGALGRVLGPDPLTILRSREVLTGAQ